MSIFNTISTKFLASTERRGRRMARQELMRMSDRQLEDFGMSRHLLMEGISAWPWQNIPAEKVAERNLASIPAISYVAKDVQGVKAIREAVGELSAYSDRELAELGVTRHTIEEAVRFGRPAIEGAAEEHRHVA